MHGSATSQGPIEILMRRFIDRAAIDADALDLALTRFEAGQRSTTEIDKLRREAHRLVGSLAVFSFVKASAEAEDFGRSVAQAATAPGPVIVSGRILTARLRNLSR